MTLDADTLRNARKFLRTPVSSYFKYSLMKRIMRWPFLSSKRKRKLTQSIRKRDYRTLSDALATFDHTSLAPPSPNFPNFQNSVVDRRSGVLFQDWHQALYKVLHTTNPADLVKDLPSVTVSLVTYNSAEFLENFLSSLRAQSFPLDRIELRITDHGSEDETVSILKDFLARHGTAFDSAKLFERNNLGFGAGHDFNIANSQAPFVLTSNVDLVLDPASILKAVAIAQADDADVACWEMRQCPYEHPKYYDPVTLEASWCSHACVLLRRTHYQTVGGYEPQIFMYGEDVELSYRLRGAGFRLRYLPQVCVTHFVDFEAGGRREHQLSGSLSADALLRYRYLSREAGDQATAQLETVLRTEPDPVRRRGMETAIEQISQKKNHFMAVNMPARRVPLLSDGHDNDLRRDGLDWPLDSMRALTETPKVSIVTRTHGPNIGVLREAIASVLNQSYAMIEHVIVEDRTHFAEDLVAEVRAAYGADIRYIKSDAGGRSAAGNAGLAAATGAFLMFLDNDDLLFADHVEILARRLIEATNKIATYSLAWEVPVFYSASGRYREGVPYTHASHRDPYKPEILRKHNVIPIQAILFRHTVYESQGGFNPDIEYLEDWDLWKRYATQGLFELIPKTTSLYKVPGDPYFQREREIVLHDALT